MLELREINIYSILLRVLAAILAGGIIGLEREMKNRPAGFRTYILVSLGSCVVMITNQYMYQVYQTGDPVRMGAQVISGIGFLGAGTIIVTAKNQIKGLTTAAGLWACACIGLAIGVGFYEVAAIGIVSMMAVLTLLHSWEGSMRRKTNTLTIYAELHDGATFSCFLKEARVQGIHLSNVQVDSESIAGSDTICFQATAKREKSANKDVFLESLQALQSVQYVEEL